MSETTTRLEELLVVGRRVRVKLSPECPLPRKPEPMAGSVVEHFPQNDGQEGQIIHVDINPRMWGCPDGHPYLVSLPAVTHRWCSSGSAYLSAEELIPLNNDGSEILHPLLARYER